MPKSHTELICWQLADQLRALVLKHTDEGTSAAKDLRFTSNLRDAVSSACRNQSEGFYKYWHTEMRPMFNTARGSLGGGPGWHPGWSRTPALYARSRHGHVRPVRPRDDREPAVPALAPTQGPPRQVTAPLAPKHRQHQSTVSTPAPLAPAPSAPSGPLAPSA